MKYTAVHNGKTIEIEAESLPEARLKAGYIFKTQSFVPLVELKQEDSNVRGC